MTAALSDQKHSVQNRTQRVLIARPLMACAECGWVHYAMTLEEKVAADAEALVMAERYQMSQAELVLMEMSVRQCLRCESPAANFRPAAPEDLAHAVGHIVTPVYIEPESSQLTR